MWSRLLQLWAECEAAFAVHPRIKSLVQHWLHLALGCCGRHARLEALAPGNVQGPDWLMLAFGGLLFSLPAASCGRVAAHVEGLMRATLLVLCARTACWAARVCKRMLFHLALGHEFLLHMAAARVWRN